MGYMYSKHLLFKPTSKIGRNKNEDAIKFGLVVAKGW